MTSDLCFRKISLSMESQQSPLKKEKKKAAVPFDSERVDSLVGGEMRDRQMN